VVSPAAAAVTPVAEVVDGLGESSSQLATPLRRGGTASSVAGLADRTPRRTTAVDRAVDDRRTWSLIVAAGTEAEADAPVRQSPSTDDTIRAQICARYTASSGDGGSVRGGCHDDHGASAAGRGVACRRSDRRGPVAAVRSTSIVR